MTRPRLRDRIYRPVVARAITSPVGVVAGSAAAAGLLASGAPVAGAVAAGALAWAVPIIRAVFSGGIGWRRRAVTDPADLPERWAAHLEDAEKALARYRRAVGRCTAGPLRERLELLEDEFMESVERCSDLALWGAEAEAARQELDPARIERTARSAGRHARHVADDQRDVMARLDAVIDEANGRLVMINGRLDEAVGRAVEMAGKSRRRAGGRDLGAGEVASKLRALRAALDEVDELGVEHRSSTRSSRSRRAASPE